MFNTDYMKKPLKSLTIFKRTVVEWGKIVYNKNVDEIIWTRLKISIFCSADI